MKGEAVKLNVLTYCHHWRAPPRFSRHIVDSTINLLVFVNSRKPACSQPPLSGDQDALPPQPDSSWVNVADIMINRVLFFLLSSLAPSGPVRAPSIPRKFVLEWVIHFLRRKNDPVNLSHGAIWICFIQAEGSSQTHQKKIFAGFCLNHSDSQGGPTFNHFHPEHMSH